MGNPGRAITLNKYLYGDADSVNNIDPSGRFSISSQMAANNIQGTLTTLVTRTQFLLRAYDTAQAVSGLFDFANVVRQVMGQMTSFSPATAARSGIPNLNYQDAIESALYNMPKAIATGVSNWGKGYSKSKRKGKKLKGFLIYMPLISAGTSGAIPIRTPAKVRFGNKKVPVKLVFGGPAGASGTLFGLGMQMGSLRQLVRMDYHRFNSGHGGSTGLKGNEISVIKDNNFHYHVNKW